MKKVGHFGVMDCIKIHGPRTAYDMRMLENNLENNRIFYTPFLKNIGKTLYTW